MHRGEIVELYSKVREQGLTLVPLRLYFRNGRAKVEVALVKGKRSWDKRQSIAQRDAKREMQRALRRDTR
jgi:SsrA-binding protein